MTDPRTAFELDGRVAVVTGAASGIGRASAQMLASARASVVCADVDLDGAQATAKEITAAGGTADAVAVDVTRRDEVDALVRGAVDAHGRLDVMANIAGIIVNNTVIDTPEDELDRVLATNFKGVFFGCQAAARAMVEQQSGSIVNMSSGAIDVPREGIVSYAVAKAGVAQLTKTLAEEVGPSGVRVNAIAPGFIMTPMTGRHFTNPDGTIDEAVRTATVTAMADPAPLRTVGDPDDIAYAVLYLASDAARFVTGQILRPNGGVAMPW
jgi:3-oxoacyl-[acyl-carrier protein] reductase